jgi:HD-GYP domain-containing protein (c-di-GMP phosphodiesterase class II)
MFVENLDRPWEGTPFLLQGVLLTTDQDIQTLRNICSHVYIDTNRGHDLAWARSQSRSPRHTGAMLPIRPSNAVPRSESSQPGKPDHRRKRNAFTGEISRARDIRAKTEILVNTMHDDVRQGRRIDTERSEVLVGEIMESIKRNPDAMIWLTHLKDRDHYTALHSMNVCALALIFGHYLGLEEPRLRELGMGALLHDIGKLRVPLEVLSKPDKLTNHEFDLVKRHPLHGLSILLDTHELPRSVLNVAHRHHEHIVGGGYPRGLKGKAIDFLSRITSIVDVYDALTSDRVYRDGMSSPEALKLMNQWRGKSLDGALLEHFIQCMGVFPSGSMVELQSGEVGVIVPARNNSRVKPIVMLILDPFKRKYYPLRIIDYQLLDGNANPERKIKRVLPNGKYGIDPINYAKEISTELKEQVQSEF